MIQIIRSGCDHTKNKTEERKVIQTNLGSMIAILTILTFYIAFLFIDNEGLHLAGAVQLPYLLLLPLIPWLNHLGYKNCTNWLLFILTMGTALTSILFAHGTILWVHHFFMMFALLPISFFTIKEWKSISLLFFVNFSLFCYFAIYGWPHHPSIDQLTEQQITLLRVMITGFCILAVLLQLIISEYHSDSNESQLQFFADIDMLTGINNRRIFIEQLQKKLQSSEEMYLLLFDLDYFKRINDTAGHYAGDKTLIHTAKTLSKHITDNDEILARIGGEEFAMLLNGKTDIHQRAENIRKGIAEIPLYFNGMTFNLTTSIGICQLQPNYQPQDILKAADKALYKAKDNGRNCVVPFELKPKSKLT